MILMTCGLHLKGRLGEGHEKDAGLITDDLESLERLPAQPERLVGVHSIAGVGAQAVEGPPLQSRRSCLIRQLARFFVVVPEASSCPPCLAVINRAARLTAGPK